MDSPSTNWSIYVNKVLTESYNLDNNFDVKSTFHVVEELNGLQLPHNYKLVSLDVKADS